MPTNHKHKYVDVLLPLALNQSFTYEVPTKEQNEVAIGKRVVVQFGKRRIYSALIVDFHSNTPTYDEIKPIISVIDEYPIVNEWQLKFWKWIAEYYMCSMGEVMKAALPSGLKLESETKVIANPEFSNFETLNSTGQVLFEFIDSKKVVSVQELTKLVQKKTILTDLKRMLDVGAIVMDEHLKESFKPKTEVFVRVNSNYETNDEMNLLFDSLARAPKQLEILMKFIQMSGILSNSPIKEVKKSNLMHSIPSNSALKSLVDKGIFELYEKESSRFSDFDNSPEFKKLTQNQELAYKQIIKELESKDVALLHGVTSSGKTEIYIKLIQDQISKGKQVLYLLPEIALTAQIISRLRKKFGNKVGVYHSKYSDSERVEVYHNILGKHPEGTQEFKIILGVRSSVFLPFSNLGLIIIDEEHENTYKQFDPAPRYNARNAAIVLASLHQSKVLLGSATPSFESYYNTFSKKYGLVELNSRYQDIQLPQIQLIDTFKARKKKQMKSLFTQGLIDEIQLALNQKEQIILFQNRRGFSPFVECNTCGWIPKCHQCDVQLTYHKYSNNLVCHYCGFTTRIPTTCGGCNSQKIETRGFGTEKIEEEIQLLFPKARLSRMDLDSTRKKHSYTQIIEDFENQNVDILIGTQMITKGLDFDNVSLVGILNADNLLNYPDFRAFERSFQLLAQVSGRAGRKNKQGKVIIQSSQPDHDVLTFVLDNRYQDFFKSQLNERKNFKYPPYCRLILLSLKHKKQEILNHAAGLFTQNLKTKLGNRVLGPQKPVISRIQNYYIKTIFVKVEKEVAIGKVKEFITSEIDRINSLPKFKSLIIVPDVDPM